jgi:hypothetical protein
MRWRLTNEHEFRKRNKAIQDQRWARLMRGAITPNTQHIKSGTIEHLQIGWARLCPLGRRPGGRCITTLPEKTGGNVKKLEGFGETKLSHYKCNRAQQAADIKGKTVPVVVQVTWCALVHLRLPTERFEQQNVSQNAPALSYLPKLGFALGALCRVVSAACVIALK